MAISNIEVMPADFKRPDDVPASEFSRIGNSFSVWLPGLEFTLTGRTVVKMTVTGTDSTKTAEHYITVFTTSINENLFPSMLVRAKMSADGKIVRPEGTFIDLYKKIVAENRAKTDAEILDAVLAVVKDKTIVVTRREFHAIGRDGSTFPSSVVDLNFKA